MKHPNLYKGRYPAQVFKSRAWLKNVSSDDRKIFGKLGLMAYAEKHGYNFWFLGGKVRASLAVRDSKGRFVRNRE